MSSSNQLLSNYFNLASKSSCFRPHSSINTPKVCIRISFTDTRDEMEINLDKCYGTHLPCVEFSFTFFPNVAFATSRQPVVDETQLMTLLKLFAEPITPAQLWLISEKMTFVHSVGSMPIDRITNMAANVVNSVNISDVQWLKC